MAGKKARGITHIGYHFCKGFVACRTVCLVRDSNPINPFMRVFIKSNYNLSKGRSYISWQRMGENSKKTGTMDFVKSIIFIYQTRCRYLWILVKGRAVSKIQSKWRDKIMRQMDLRLAKRKRANGTEERANPSDPFDQCLLFVLTYTKIPPS